MKKINFKSVSAALSTIAAVLLISGMAVSANAYDRQSNNEKSVSVDVLPVELTAGKPAKFEIRMSTHSVTLNNDMVAGSVLQDDSGAEYKAVKWDGTPPGGHHRTGTLEFEAIKGTPKAVTLIIMGVSEVPQRIYKWKIK